MRMHVGIFKSPQKINNKEVSALKKLLSRLLPPGDAVNCAEVLSSVLYKWSVHILYLNTFILHTFKNAV